MQLHLDGSNTINAPQEKVYSLLTDPHFIATTLPDSEDVHVMEDGTVEARLRLRIAVVSTTMKTKMMIKEREPPSKATLVAEGAGGGSNMKVRSLFSLEGGLPTKMNWSADAEITGVMAGLGSALLRGFATKKVSEIFVSITKAVEDASK